MFANNINKIMNSDEYGNSLQIHEEIGKFADDSSSQSYSYNDLPDF